MPELASKWKKKNKMVLKIDCYTDDEPGLWVENLGNNHHVFISTNEWQIFPNPGEDISWPENEELVDLTFPGSKSGIDHVSAVIKVTDI